MIIAFVCLSHERGVQLQDWTAERVDVMFRVAIPAEPKKLC